MRLQTRNLSLNVDTKRLISGLDWTVESGQCWFVVGRNGTGKTTLLKTLTGLRPADGGEVWLDERPLSSWTAVELARQRAYLPQGREDAFGFTVFETVLASRFPYRAGRLWESEEEAQTVRHSLMCLDALDLAERDIRSLSGGERQRVAIAALLAQDTPLMLLDEPAAALDLAHRVLLMKTMAALCREQNRAVVMVVHDLNLAFDVASHVLLLYGDGDWEAGGQDAMMCPEKLTRCLQYPVKRLCYGNRPVFVSF